MKTNPLKILVLAFSISFTVTYAQTTKTVGNSDADYTTLQSAFSAINNGLLTGQVVLQIVNNTTETNLTQLNASGNGSANYSSVLIYPMGTYSISCASNQATIVLNGADNVTIDGRINQSGSTQSLSIVSTNTGNGSTAIRFINSAENNTIRYCNLTGSSASSSVGVVTIAWSDVGNGNDNNTIEFCSITCSGSNRPYNGITSSGTSGRENSGCIIRNNNIYNTFQTGVSSNAINIATASVGFTISGNSIYETTSFVATASGASYNAIRISAAEYHVVTGNYIGGSAPQCGGSPWSFRAERAVYFCGIFSYASAGTPSIISDNVIANMDYSSKEDNPWDGIFLYSGNFEVTGNTIGATTGTGSIVSRTPVPVATTTLVSGGISTTINVLHGGSGYSVPPAITFTAPPAGGTAPTATAVITAGVVTSITVNSQGSGYTTAPAVIFDGQSNNYSTSHGMIQNSTGIVNITGNNIGSITIEGSDFYSHGFESIYVRTVAATTTINNNLVGSLTTANSIHVSSAAGSSLIKQDVYGIYSASTLTTTISGNIVANLTNAYTGNNTNAKSRGIQTIGGSNTITSNTVFNISTASRQASGGSNSAVIGISQTSTTANSTQIINGNTVYNISCTNNTSAKNFMSGIFYNGPTSATQNVSNNFVHSLSLASTDLTSAMAGIEFFNGSYTCANNIVCLGKNTSAGYQINGIWDVSGSSWTRNIYFNTVHVEGTVTSGSSASAALRSGGNTATRNYRNNIFNNVRSGGGDNLAITVTGTTGLTIGYNDYVGGLSGITLNTAPDNNSLAINPQFANAGGTSAINYYPSANLPAVVGTGITTDYYNIARSGITPKMGALEINQNVWQGGTSTDFNTASNWANNEIPASGADIFFATSPINDCVLDANRTVGTVTNGSSKNLVVNGKTLTVNGSLNFTSSGKINTSTASSVVKFAGSAAQTIPAAVFVSNTVAGLEIDNSAGVALSGNLTGTASLTLTSGVLTVGENSLTYSGSSPTSAGGTVDASNASAELVFANNSAITLPATFFSGAVNNLTISESGGVTAGSNITVNGILNLAAANPDATKGLLEMTIDYGDYSNVLTPDNELTTRGTQACDILSSHILTMGPSASYAGSGDVTGRVKRTSIAPDTEYFMGSAFTSITFSSAGTLPTQIMFVITKGPNRGIHANATAHNNLTVERLYQIIQTGGSDPNSFVLKLRYLDSELNSNDESKLVLWDHHIKYSSTNTPHEHGKTSQNSSENWVSLSGHAISYLATSEVIDGFTKYWMTNSTGLTDVNINTWNGAGPGDDGYKWDYPSNWTKGTVPTSVSKVFIPQTAKAPTMASTSTAATITIEAGAVLNGGTGTTLTVSGGPASNGGVGSWNNAGTFNAGTSTVVFDYIAGTFDGTTDFYNITINSGKELALQESSIMRIGGTFTNSGVLNAYLFNNTVEYNGGSQTIINPGGTQSAYSNLTLSGTGTKTMPSTAMTIKGNLNIEGTASATAGNSLAMDGNLLIGSGAIFGTGTYSHQLKGNLTCDGTLTPSAGSLITMNGSSAQNIQGDAASIALGGLTINNSSGVTLYNHATTEALGISTGTFTVTAGKSVTASGATTLGSAQCFILKSDENGTASFIDNGTISGTGTARVERYITPYDEVPDLKFHFLSSPVETQAIEPEFMDLSSLLVTDFYMWNEPGNVWVSYRKGDWSSGENPDYHVKNPDFTDVNFVQGKGYMVAYPAAVTKNFIGLPATSASGITVSCSKTTGGWNLVGNPFPSSIDWDLLTKTNVDATLYYYDNSIPAYKYYNPTSGGIGGATEFIPPMQGFMVHASNTGSLGMANTARTHSGQSVFFKDVPLNTNILDLKLEGNDKADYARVCFYEAASENFDPDFDAFKIFSYSPKTTELYSKTANNTSLAINTLPLAIMDGGSVPLRLKVSMTGNFILIAERLNSFSSNTYITLEDKLTGHLQKLNDNPVYAFSVTSQDDEDRFVLHFTDATSISEPALQNSIKAWFSNGKLTVETQAGTTILDIFNVQGQNLRSIQLRGSGLQQVPVNLSAGIYFARLTNSGQMQTIKIIIQ